MARNAPSRDPHGLTAYEEYQVASGRLAERTIKGYIAWLSLTADFLEERHQTLLTATTADLDAFLSREARRKLAQSSRYSEWITLREFFKWAIERHLVRINPMDAAIRVNRGDLPQVDYYTDAQVARIIEWARNQPGLRWRVGWVLLVTAWLTGLRLAELEGLLTDNVDLDAGLLQVTGKGSKTRLVPLPEELVGVLEDYLESVRPQLPASAYFFVNPRSRHSGSHVGRFGSRSIGNLVKAAGKGAGVPGRHHTHRFRHTYATSLIRREVDISLVQKALGHSWLATTARYLHLDVGDLSRAVNRAYADLDLGFKGSRRGHGRGGRPLRLLQGKPGRAAS